MFIATRHVFYKVAGTYQWTPPDGLSMILLTMQAAGGGGGKSFSTIPGTNTPDSGAGGGSGEVCVNRPIHVEPGIPITIVVGAGGAGQISAGGIGGAGSAGTDTSFGSLVVGAGGAGLGSSGGVEVGGPGGGFGGDIVNSGITDGRMGAYAGPTHTGGSSGAQSPLSVVFGRGGPFGGTRGAVAAFTNGVRAPGGGGAAGLFGTGGAGGDHKGSVPAGQPGPYPGSGGGGGGADTGNNQQPGGRGADGFVLISWIGP